MVGSIIDDSCKLVYTTNRIGRPNEQCLGDSKYDTGIYNNRKFEINGCSKVDRPNTCNQTLFRG